MIEARIALLPDDEYQAALAALDIGDADARSATGDWMDDPERERAELDAMRAEREAHERVKRAFGGD